MLTIQQLEILLAIEKTGSLRKAADMLFLSQPALSVSIKKMEDELGTQLFIRKSTGIELTAICEEILPIATEVISQMKKLEIVCSEYALLHKNIIPNATVTFKAYPQIATIFFPQIVIPLKKILPQLNVNTKNISMEDKLVLKNDDELIIYIEHVGEDDLENSHSHDYVMNDEKNCRLCSIYPCINMHKDYFPQMLSMIKDNEVVKLPLLMMFRESPSAIIFSGKILEHLSSIREDLEIIDCSSISMVKAYIDAKMGVGLGWYFSAADKTNLYNTMFNENYVAVPLEFESKSRFYLSVKYSSKIPEELIVLLKNIVSDCLDELNHRII